MQNIIQNQNLVNSKWEDLPLHPDHRADLEKSGLLPETQAKTPPGLGADDGKPLKIRPIFDTSLYAKLGYSVVELSYENSLESQVSKWEKSEQARNEKDDYVKFTVTALPELIRSTLHYLRQKHENLSSQAWVSRFLTKAGVIVLEKIPGLKTIRDRRRQLYEVGDEQRRLAVLAECQYSIKYFVSMTDFRATIYTFAWVGSKINDLAADLSLPQQTLVTEALIAGMSTSEKWIPERYQIKALDEVVRFANWVDQISRRLEQLK